MKSLLRQFAYHENDFEFLVRPLEAFAFWSAVALPFLYVPLLFYGLHTTQHYVAFFGMLLLNIIAFVIGHGYNRG